MFRLLFLALLTVVALVAAQTASNGCGSALPDGQQPGGFYEATVKHRRYFVFIPPEYSISRPTSLVVSYHAGSRGVKRQVGLDLFTDPKYNTNKLVVYPEGSSRLACKSDNTCNKRYWNLGMGNVTADDIEFTSSILKEVQNTYCVDKNRIFASGKSQGAGFVGRSLACDRTLSQTFAAFALVSGALYTEVKRCEPPFEIEIPCNPGRTDVPILEIHGGKDEVAKYQGDSAGREDTCLPSILWWIETWVKNDGLGMGKTTQLAADTPNTKVTKYGSGEREGLVTHIYDADVAHHWPSKSKNSDNHGALAKFEASPLILEFFDAHPLNRSLLENEVIL